MSRKLLVHDGTTQRELLLVGTMIVGRHPACEISSPDPRLSRRHAEITVTADGVSVRDLQSRNGIRVNGQPVTEAWLQPGDILHVAHLALQFAPENALPARPPSLTGTSETLAVAAPASGSGDDRTRVVRPSVFGVNATGAPSMTVDAALLDERTRVATVPLVEHAPARSGSAVAASSGARRPVEAGDLVIRERTADDAGARMLVYPELGMAALARAGWGRRVLAHGVLLALLVQLVTLVPVLVWQAQVFGVSVLSAWHVLLPAAGAAVLAGLLVSTLIARLTARGVAALAAGTRRAG